MLQESPLAVSHKDGSAGFYSRISQVRNSVIEGTGSGDGAWGERDCREAVACSMKHGWERIAHTKAQDTWRY